MQVFVSWSGDRSRLIAEAIRGWLPKVIQSIKPWMSDEDISAGSRWLTEVSSILNSAKVGLICVTPENQHNPWLLFEAGALSKTLEQTCVCPLVYEMTAGQLSGPLTQFQANTLDRDGMLKILSTLNKALSDHQIDPRELEEILDVWWPKLAEKLAALPPVPSPTVSRTIEDQMEELLQMGREQLRRENIRLESQREREDKFDQMLSIMDRANSTMTSLQGNSNKARTSLQNMMNTLMAQATNSIDGEDEQGAELLKMLSSCMPKLPPIDFGVDDLQSATGQLRELHERDKQRLSSMLSPGKEDLKD